MKKILLLLLITFIFLTGCSLVDITGRIAQEVEKVPTQLETDQANLGRALSEKQESYCYPIQNQDIREDCFISVAHELRDPGICNNLLGNSLRDSCKKGIE